MNEKFENAIEKALEKSTDLMIGGDVRDISMMVGAARTLILSYIDWLNNVPTVESDDGEARPDGSCTTLETVGELAEAGVRQVAEELEKRQEPQG